MRLHRKRSADWRGHGLVLLVEDEDPVRRYAARTLTELGFTVVGAADGNEALEIFQERKGELVLVVLDLTLPGLSGEAVLTGLEDHATAVPVVLSSGADPATARRRYRGHAVAGFLPKPYGLEQMRATLSEVLP